MIEEPRRSRMKRSRIPPNSNNNDKPTYEMQRCSSKVQILRNVFMIFGILFIMAIVGCAMYTASKHIGVKVKENHNTVTNTEEFYKYINFTNITNQSDFKKLLLPKDVIEDHQAKITGGFYYIFICCSMILSFLIVYLCMSFGNTYKLKSTFSTPLRKILGTLIMLILATGLSLFCIYITNEVILKKHVTDRFFHLVTSGNFVYNGETNSNTNKEIKYSAIKIIEEGIFTGSKGDYYNSSNSDESAILIKKEGSAELETITINKNSGSSNNVTESELYGINSAFLVTGKKAKASLQKSCSINVNSPATDSTALFATENSKVNISSSKINTNNNKCNGIVVMNGANVNVESTSSIITTSENSIGILLSNNGNLLLDNSNVNTKGANSPAIMASDGINSIECKAATLETSGNSSPAIKANSLLTSINCSNCVLNTNGENSGLLYSDGTINLVTSTGKAQNSECAIIENNSTISIENSNLTCNGNTGQFIIKANNNKTNHAVLNCTNSRLNISDTAPLFYVDNANIDINLNGCQFDYNANLTLFNIMNSENNPKINLFLNNQNFPLNNPIKIIAEKKINLKVEIGNNSSLNGFIKIGEKEEEINIDSGTYTIG